MVRPEIILYKISANNRTYMCTPTEVGIFPAVPGLWASSGRAHGSGGPNNTWSTDTKSFTGINILNSSSYGPKKKQNMFGAPHLCVE